MELVLVRYSSGKTSTLGLLFEEKGSVGHFMAFTLEDSHREVKVEKETRIPAGTYELAFREEGGMVNRYNERFADIDHRGMLWLQTVPGFHWVYIHCGNTDKHTEGCILVGNGVTQNITEGGSLMDSSACYRRVYARVAAAIEAEGCSIRIEDVA